MEKTSPWLEEEGQDEDLWISVTVERGKDGEKMGKRWGKMKLIRKLAKEVDEEGAEG